ncbi:hypothetical protein [Brachybacterium hainanense]|uniref:Uncharacterized protein n=1 Tax=Brachybacterium hainanense TaxID=1541174 RepID=A0ABV6R6N1_9MICO
MSQGPQGNPSQQPPQWQPAPGQDPQAHAYAPPGPPAPPQRKRPWALILVAVGCVLLLFVGVLGGLGYLAYSTLRSDDPTAGPTTATAPPTEAPTPSGSEVVPFTPVAPYDENTRSPEEIREILAGSPLTRGSYPPIGECTLPTLAADPSAEELQAFLTAGTGCLGGTWAPVLAAENLPWQTPTVVVFTWPDVPASSDCDASTFSQNAPRMCNLDNILYWPLGAGRFAPLAAPEQLGEAYLMDLSYQLMNTVTWQSSIAVYMNFYQDEFEESDPEFRDSYRRFNLQMRCLSAATAMQLPEGARPSPALQEILLDESTWELGEDPRSVPPAATVRWTRIGIDSQGDMSACNTWVADPADIDR